MAQWADQQWNAEWEDNPIKLHIFISDTHHPEWPSQQESGSGVGTSAPVLDVSAAACTNGVWPPLRPVSVAQKNKPSTMLSSNVQSIDLPMDYMAWRFWTMRQQNGCSTHAPRSSAAKQWFEQLAQKKKIMAQEQVTRNDTSILRLLVAMHEWCHHDMGWLNFVINTLASGHFLGFPRKITETHVALRRNFSGPVSTTVPVKVSKDTASQVPCTRKKIFDWGCGFFVSDVINGGLLGHLGPLHLAVGANCEMLIFC